MSWRMHIASCKTLIFVVISVLVVALMYSSFPKSYVVFAATKGPIECRLFPGTTTEQQRFEECCQTTTEDNGIEIHWCTICDGDGTHCGPRYPQTDAPPPPSTGTCLDSNQALGATGNCAPLTQTPEQPPTNQTPSPKGGPGKLLPEGVFGGPTTKPSSPQQGQTTPEVAPPTGPEGDNETQSRINTSPTGGCIPFIKTQCVPCDPGLPGGDCILEDDWETTIGTTDTGTPQGAAPLVPPTTEETAPQVAPPSTTVEEPTCPAGQELDEDTNLCVPVSQEQEEQQQQQPGVTEEEPQTTEEAQQPQAEEPEQSSEGEGSQENSNNGN